MFFAISILPLLSSLNRLRFILGENGFSKVSSDPHIIVETLNLVMGGMSYRYIARHIFTTHQIKISHISIMNWVRKYTQLMKEYVDKLVPEYQEVWSVDEMMLNVKGTKPMGKGYYSWMWSIIHPQTSLNLKRSRRKS
jgi:transposase-like protein